MELREPKRKRRVRIALQQPFPILNRDVTTNRELWQVYTGRYSGDFVVVDAPDEMAALHNMGFFGKGSLSRGAPEFGKEKQGTPPFVRQRQWERRCKWAEQQKELMKQFNKTHKKAKAEHKVQNTSTETKPIEVDEISTLEDGKAQPCNDEVTVKNGVNNKDNDIKNKEKELNVDVTSMNDNKGSHNVDEDIITLDSAEEDNGHNDNRIKDNLDKSNNKKSGKSEKENNEQCEKDRTKRKRSATCTLDEQHDQSYDVNEERMLLVLPDSDDDDEQYLANINPKLEKDPFLIYESLHLTLEEAFFLSYGLGCLQVLDMFGNCLSIDGMWQLFCKSQKDFIQKYVAYHYFRSKGWVVKPGIKFGGDFLLYKQGPPFYHASYMIVLEVVDSATLKRHPAARQTLTWTRLMGLNRLAETAGKEVILCQIMWPSEAGPKSLEEPSVLFKFQVHEVLVRRWVSSQEREENDTL